MRMVVDTMSLEEVGLHILNLYRDNYMRILNILGHREPQYRKAVYANDRLYINMDRYLSLDATIYLDCLFFDGRTNEIECNDFVIDSEHYFMKNEEI